jgi:hypothetical protein
MNNGINLVADKRSVKSVSIIKDRLKVLRFSSMTMLFIIGAGAVIISILIVFSPLPQLRRDEEKIKTKLSVFQPDIYKLAFINERGDSIRKVISQRPGYDKKIEVIESRLPADVNLETLTINKKNYTLKFSSNNLNSLDGLLKNLVDATGKDKDFIRVYLTSISLDKDNQKFTLIVDLLTT